MASSAKIVSRLSSLALKFHNKKTVLSASLLNSASHSAINRRVSVISRLPVELSSLETMMPLHSAIASARLKSSLPLASQRWGLVPQGVTWVFNMAFLLPLSLWSIFLHGEFTKWRIMCWYLYAFIVLPCNETVLSLAHL